MRPTAWIPTVVVCVLVGVGACTDVGLIAIGAAAGLVGVALLLARPIALVTAALVSVLFAQTITHFAPTAAALHFDEVLPAVAILALPIRRLMRGEGLRSLPGSKFFLAFGVVGVVSALAADVPMSVLLLGSYAPLRGLALGWAVAQHDWSEADLVKVARFGRWLLGALLASGVANLAMPGAWNQVFSAAPDPGYAGYVFGVVGPFVHPSFYGQILALGAIVLVAQMQVKGRRAGHPLLLAGSILFALLSFRRKTWVSLPAGLMRTVYSKAPVAAIVGVAVLAPTLVFAAAPAIQPIVERTYQSYLANPDDNARTAITFASPEVAGEHFPLGAGFGRFGSVTAATEYSPEYRARGFQSIYGLEPENPRFATDTFWPAVLGEAGWFGLALFVVGLIALYRFTVRPRDDDSDTVRILRATGAGWMVMLLVESVAAPVFSGPPTYPAVFVIVGLIVALRSSDRDRSADLVPVGAVVGERHRRPSTRSGV